MQFEMIVLKFDVHFYWALLNSLNLRALASPATLMDRACLSNRLMSFKHNGLGVRVAIPTALMLMAIHRNHQQF